MKITTMIAVVALATGITNAASILAPHGDNNTGVTGITTYGTGASDTINTTLSRVGGNGGTREFSTYLAFDVSSVTLTGPIIESVLEFDTTLLSGTAFAITVDYLGTFADITADAATTNAWYSASAISTLTTTITSDGTNTLDAGFSGYTSADFANDYAVFRLTTPDYTTADGISQWDITNSSLSIPEPTSVALLGLGGLALVSRRKR